MNRSVVIGTALLLLPATKRTNLVRPGVRPLRLLPIVAALLAPACGTMVTNISVAQDAGGLPIAAFGLSTIDSQVTPPRNDEVLKLVRCEDAACGRTTVSTLDATGGRDISLAIGADGRGLISYTSFGRELLVARCVDAACTTITTSALGDREFPSDTSLVIGADGLGLISYRSHSNGSLKVAHCEDAACTHAILTVLEAATFPARSTSIAIGADGLGVITYEIAAPNGTSTLRIAHCENPRCTAASFKTLDEGYIITFSPALTRGSDGLILVVYTESKEGRLRAAHCVDAACRSVVTSTIGIAGQYSGFTSVALGSDGLPLISYAGGFFNELRVAHCANAECSRVDSSSTLDRGTGMHPGSLIIGLDGLARISYGVGSSPRLARCVDVPCTSAIVTPYNVGAF